MKKPLPLFTRAFVDSWRSTLGWALGLAATIFLCLPLYPSIGASPEMQRMMEAFPPELLTDSAQLNIRPVNLFGASVLFAGLTMLSGSTALFAGAVTGRKTYGLAAGAGVGVLGYVFNAVGRQSREVDWLLDLSPYNWAYGNSPGGQRGGLGGGRLAMGHSGGPRGTQCGGVEPAGRRDAGATGLSRPS